MNTLPAMACLPEILIVDDDTSVIFSLSKVLHKIGHTRFATDGLQALALIHKVPPDLILLDMEMPGMNGLEVCAVLKADPSTADIPVLFITMHTEAAFEEKVFKAGAADYVPKPLNPLVVAARVSTHLAYRAALAQLTKLATKDGLTGLNNRRSFDEKLAQEWKRALRHKLPLALLMLDIDEFKKYNDHFGHLVGDSCLKSVAAALQDSARRPADFVARYGGEEFVLILPGTDANGAETMARILLNSVENERIAHAPNAMRKHLTVSIGSCVLDAAHVDAAGLEESALIVSADRALYQSKKEGRNCSTRAELGQEAGHPVVL